MPTVMKGRPILTLPRVLALWTLAMAMAWFCWKAPNLHSNGACPAPGSLYVWYLPLAPWMAMLVVEIVLIVLCLRGVSWGARHLSLAARTVILLAQCVCALALLEGSVRTYEGRYVPPVAEGFVSDGLLGWKNASFQQGRFGDFGLRDPPTALSSVSSEYRVLCLGDSSTFGVGVSSQDAYPAQLQRFLQERMPTRHVTVFNGGVPGFSSLQGSLYFRKYAPLLHPDLTLWCFAHGDSSMAQVPDAIAMRYYVPALSHSRLYAFVRELLISLSASRQGPVLRVTPAEAADLFVENEAIARRNGAHLVLLLMPDRSMKRETLWTFPWLPPDGVSLRAKFMNQEITARMARRLGISVMDARYMFTAGDFIKGDVLHLNGEGCRILAGSIVTRLAQDGRLPTREARAEEKHRHDGSFHS